MGPNQMMGVLVKKGKDGHGDRHVQREDGVKKHRETMLVYKPRTEGGLEQSLSILPTP